MRCGTKSQQGPERLHTNSGIPGLTRYPSTVPNKSPCASTKAFKGRPSAGTISGEDPGNMEGPNLSSAGSGPSTSGARRQMEQRRCNCESGCGGAVPTDHYAAEPREHCSISSSSTKTPTELGDFSRAPRERHSPGRSNRKGNRAYLNIRLTAEGINSEVSRLGTNMRGSKTTSTTLSR